MSGQNLSYEPQSSNKTPDPMNDISFLLGSDPETSSDKPRVLSVLSILFERMVDRNDRLSSSGFAGHYNPGKLTVFHGLRAPTITIDKYMERIFKYANCSPSCFVVAYVYIDRLIHLHPELPVTSLNVHRLLVTSVMVAAKFLDDAYFNNAYYAKVGGVSTAEMNRLELEFLFSLNFRLNVTPSVFSSYCSHLEYELQATLNIKISSHLSIKPFEDLVSESEFSKDTVMDEYVIKTPPREMESYSQKTFIMGPLAVQ